MARCGGRCEVVKKSGKRCWDKATDVDHKSAGDDHSLENLQGICQWHHRRKSAMEGVAAKAALNSILTRPEEPHPGLLPKGTPPPRNKGF